MTDDSQLEYRIVRRDNLHPPYSLSLDLYCYDGYKDPLWHCASIPERFRERLAEILPPATWALPSWGCFGEEFGDLVEVVEEGGAVYRVHLQVNVRQPNRRVLRSLTRLLAECDLLLVGAGFRVVEPSALLADVDGSSAPAGSAVGTGGEVGGARRRSVRTDLPCTTPTTRSC